MNWLLLWLRCNGKKVGNMNHSNNKNKNNGTK